MRRPHDRLCGCLISGEASEERNTTAKGYGKHANAPVLAMLASKVCMFRNHHHHVGRAPYVELRRPYTCRLGRPR